MLDRRSRPSENKRALEQNRRDSDAALQQFIAVIVGFFKKIENNIRFRYEQESVVSNLKVTYLGEFEA